MKRKLAVILLAGMVTASMAGCGSDSSGDAGKTEAPTESATETPANDGAETADADSEDPSSADESKFIVGFDAEYPPYGYMDDNGEYVGFDLELAQEVCDRNEWELVKQPIDWNSKDMELSSGSIDCIWNGFTMTGREEDYTFSEPYVDNSIVVVASADSDISSLEDLAGKVVVTQSDSSALSALTDDSEENADNLALAATFASLEQVADYNTAFLNLESGAVDAIAVDIGVADYQLESRGSEFKMLDEPISTEQYAIGFKLGNTGLRDKVQATLDEMVEDGTFDKIAETWDLSDMVCLGKDK